MGLEIIEQLKKEKNLTNEDLARLSGIPKGTIDKITAGVTTDPKLGTIRALSRALGCTLNDFIDGQDQNAYISLDERTIIKKYRALDEHGKEMVDIVLEKEAARMATANAEASAEMAPVTYYSVREQLMPMSAGYGNPDTDDSWDELLLTKRPPRGTSFVARISGDSMEPTFQNGDRVFVRSQEEIRPGEIGVFWMDGRQWVKELGDGKLISHNPNPEYGPRPMTEDIVCQGKVLGICDRSYFE